MPKPAAILAGSVHAVLGITLRSKQVSAWGIPLLVTWIEDGFRSAVPGKPPLLCYQHCFRIVSFVRFMDDDDYFE